VFASQRGICFIRLDNKARLVLPLEIRDALGIRKNEKILLSFSDAKGKKITVDLAKAPENVESRAFSRNGSYVKTNEVRK